jgi:hypothetical protein
MRELFFISFGNPTYIYIYPYINYIVYILYDQCVYIYIEKERLDTTRKQRKLACNFLDTWSPEPNVVAMVKELIYLDPQ